MKPRTAYAVRKAPSIIKLADVKAFIILVAMHAILDVNKIGLISLVNEPLITSAEYMSQLN